MSAIEILAAGAKANSGVGSAVDVSGFSTLRLNATLSANFGKNPWLRLFIETAPSANGPWKAIWSRHFVASATSPGLPYHWDPVPRILLSPFDSFVRARWEGAASVPGDASAEFNIALAGDGQPDGA